MRWFALPVLLLLSACGGMQKVERPQSLDQFLAYVQAQCTQVRVSALNLAASGSLSWEGAGKAQQFADTCRSSVTFIQSSVPDLGCLLPSGDKDGTCGQDQLKAWADAAAWLSRASALIADKWVAK